MSEAQLYEVSGAKSVSSPGLSARTLPAHPIPKQLAIVRIAIGVSTIGVENTRSIVGVAGTAALEAAGKIRVSTLDTKIQLIEFGDFGQVQARPYRRIPPIRYRRELILNKRLRIESQPVLQPGNSESEVQS
jgi:hypothetical protein